MLKYRGIGAIGAAAVIAVAAAGPATAASDDTTLSTSVNTRLVLSAPASVDFGALDVGGTSDVKNVPVNVVSNDSQGYQLSVARTVFTRSDRDIPVSVLVPKASLPNTATDADPDVPTAVPASGPALNLSNRTSSITAESGDNWALGMRLGPVPFTQDGGHTSTVTLTAVGL